MNRFWNVALGFKSYAGIWPILTGLLIYVLVAMYSGYSGVQWRLEVEKEQSSPPREFAESRAAWFDALQRVENGEEISSALARPMNLPILAVRPPGALSELSNRNEDLYPSATVLNGFKNEMLLFRRYELDSPTSLQWGSLDLSFVVMALLPLVVIFLGYDVLNADRESGRLKVAVASGHRAPVLLWQTLLIATVPLLLATNATAIAISFFAAPFEMSRAISLVFWLVCANCYWLFWVTLTALVATISRTSLNAALALVSFWIVFVVLVPGFLQFIGNAVYDSPSKVSLQTVARLAEADALKSFDRRVEAFLAGHSNEVSVGDENVPDYYRAAYIGNRAVNENIRKKLEIVASIEERRVNLLNFLALVSPVTQVQLAFEDVAQTGRSRAMRYQSQVRDCLRRYNEAIGPATLGKARLDMDEAEAIGEFQFRENGFSTSVWRGCIVLLIFAAVLAMLATKQAYKLERQLN